MRSKLSVESILLLGLFTFLNIFIIQWICMRLTIQVDRETGRTQKLGVLFPVVPLTGFFRLKYYPPNYKSYFFLHV